MNNSIKIPVTFVPSEVKLEDAYTQQLVASQEKGCYMQRVHILYVSEMQ